MRLFMGDAEVTKDQAASKVANRLQKTPFHTYGGKPITAKMVASWHDQYIGFPSEAHRYGAAIFQMVLIAARGKFLTPATRAAAVIEIGLTHSRASWTRYLPIPCAISLRRQSIDTSIKIN